MSDDFPIIEKTSAWSESEREKPAEIEQRRQDIVIPPWASALNPETPFVANGWHCEIRHVGYEGGRWMLLVEPVRPAGVLKSKARNCAEYKRMVKTVGKKEARKRTKKHAV